MTPKKIAALALVGVFLLVGIVSLDSLIQNVDADEILVIQSPISGELTWHTDAGMKVQNFGKVTTYPKRSIYEFEAPVQFNDGGKGIIHGSIQYDLPLDVENLTELHTRFGSRDAIQKQVMEVVTNKVIYMTGPVMSSRESYAEKRNYLINYIQDQIDYGVYQTAQAQQTVTDELSGKEKTITVAQIVTGDDGRPLRQEDSVVGEFEIRAFNFAIESIDYDDVVERQIEEQQAIAMKVQTSIANALEAQQAAITVAEQGRAEAEKAKWEQEVVKAKQVTEAQQRLEVARLDREAAEQTKQQQILLGQGEAERKRLVMNADGALDKKLNAAIKINEMYANAIANYKGDWVPRVQMGNSGSNTAPGGASQELINLLTMQTANQLGLDMKVKKGND